MFLGLGQSLLFYFAFGSFTQVIIPDIIVSFIIYSGIALVLWYPFSYFNASISKPTVLISNLVAIGAITLTIWAVITWFLVGQLLPDGTDYATYWEVTFPYRIGTGIFIYGLIILSYYLFISLTNLSEKNAKEARLENLLKETEIKMLRSQINPHFLFNCLNSISSLTITDPEKAREMVIKLSDFMRYALSKKDEQPVSLRSELENLRLYLDIEKVRFGERLSIEENIEEKCLDTKIPVMLLQPLIENAVKHGVYESTESVRISTRTKIIDNHVTISITNNFDTSAPSKRGTGTGLMNVSRRLELFYGNNASISTLNEKGFYTVTISLPVEE